MLIIHLILMATKTGGKRQRNLQKVIIIMWIVDNTRINMKLHTFYRLVQCAEIKCTVYSCLLQFIRMFDHIAKCIVFWPYNYNLLFCYYSLSIHFNINSYYTSPKAVIRGVKQIENQHREY